MVRQQGVEEPDDEEERRVVEKHQHVKGAELPPLERDELAADDVDRVARGLCVRVGRASSLGEKKVLESARTRRYNNIG